MSFKNQISHKNPDFQLLLRNGKIWWFWALEPCDACLLGEATLRGSIILWCLHPPM